VHIYPTLGDLPLDQITRAAVRSWYDKLDTGPTARAHAYSTLRTILNTAVVDDELLQRNPAYIRGAGVSGGRKSLRPGSLDELAAMVDAMPERRRLLLLLATWCALRSGELRELRRSDIELGRDEDGDAFGWGTSGERSCWRVPVRQSAGAVPPQWSAGRRPTRA
jgi:integrase